jgi:hypothetical protein
MKQRSREVAKRQERWRVGEAGGNEVRNRKTARKITINAETQRAQRKDEAVMRGQTAKEVGSRTVARSEVGKMESRRRELRRDF